jgi:hypothetical protein
MNQKTMISITLMAAFSIAIVSTGMKAEAYTSEQLQSGISQSAHATSLLRIGTLVLENCASQASSGDYSNMDACLNFTEVFDRHITAMMGETKGDIQSITGLGYGLN